MKAPPLLLGGKSPVVAYLRHSMIVYVSSQKTQAVLSFCLAYRFSRAIVSNYERQGSVKLDIFGMGIAK